MHLYVFFVASTVVHVVSLEYADHAWAADFARRQDYTSWQVTRAYDAGTDGAEVDAKYR